MSQKIAVIPGDGIGVEVMAEGLRVLQAVSRRFQLSFQFDTFDWGCDHYERHGRMMPADWKTQIGRHDAILFGAVGAPDRVPDHIAIWESIITIRREFDQYVNLRPARLMRGVPCPLAGRAPGDIDFLVVRENTEGEYSNAGGRMFAGTDREIAIQESVFSRFGADRVLRYAFELAASRPRRHLTAATKSNGISITMPFWDERVEAIAQEHPQVSWDKFHIDILCAHLVQHPDRFDVIVASNLFGDILSDLGPACTGTIGIAPSANLNPDRVWPSLFEPVHGSAPDIAGRGIANPVGQIWSAALMLDHLSQGQPACSDAAHAVMQAIEAVLADGPRTPDMGGNANTVQVGQAIAEHIDKA
ncbi:tartrate dehydrogenase [Castellaniella sp.]|uniref:tartrate dehydrogenase n=1 Tax=Castellaniella sp. TaxID=1955812 RepID=UPI002AFFFD2C|nr:tartrate dehydrogenase [Castellaniella sp.]